MKEASKNKNRQGRRSGCKPSISVQSPSATEKSIGLAIRDMLDDPEVRGRLYTAIAGIEALDDPKYAKKAKRHRRWLEDIDRRRPI
jgi:hypothetical protein